MFQNDMDRKMQFSMDKVKRALEREWTYNPQYRNHR